MPGSSPALRRPAGRLEMPRLRLRPEGLEKVFGRGETNPALLDQLRSRLVSETVAHHAYDLLLRKGLGRAALGHL